MSGENKYSFTRYLAAKKGVDDRAINQLVWEILKSNLPAATPGRPLKVLEVGAGIGTMIERMFDWELLSHSHYTAIDNDPANITYAHKRMQEWAVNGGYAMAQATDGLQISHPDQHITLVLENIDLFDFITSELHQTWDLLVAHAFLDLVDIRSTLPLLLHLLKPRGMFYFTINFDGLTLLEPTIDPSLDDLIQELYHRTMDERIVAGKRAGDSRTGRRLFGNLKAAGAEILGAGSSDWIVFPTSDGYPADEAYFLHFIIDTIHQALAMHPKLDAQQFSAWIAKRHTQIENAELVFIAHQIDLVGRYPGSADGQH